MTNFLNSKMGFYGYDHPSRFFAKGIFPRLTCARAISEAMPCLTEVIDWPFSEDDAGIPFDQANLYGVRTIAYTGNDFDEDGLEIPDSGDVDRHYWTAVPKTLPPGYTSTGRCGQLADLFPNLADDPFEALAGGEPPLSETWQLRYARGVFPHYFLGYDEFNEPIFDDVQLGYASWRPRNLNQLTIGAVSAQFNLEPPGGDTGLGTWHENMNIGPWREGFRGFKIILYQGYNDGHESLVFPNFFLRVGFGPEAVEPPYTDLSGHTVVSTGTYSSSTDTGPTDQAGGWDHWLVDEHIVNAAVDFPIGQVGVAFAQGHWNGDHDDGGVMYHHVEIIIGPRTNIPLHYTATMGNRVAPGGVPTGSIPA